MKTQQRYRVTTWDMELQEYTPQEGMRCPYDDLTLGQLREAIIELQELGYGCRCVKNADGGYDTNDTAVLVERLS